MALGTVRLSESRLREHESMPLPRPKAGQPRLDPRKAILYNFYERLVLLEILQRNRAPLVLAPASSPETIARYPKWRTFLNQLSWLCDYGHGGDSTSSVAAEATPTGPKFWLAANFDPDQTGLGHLEMVLEKLSRLKTLPSEMQRVVFDEILERSLVFSSKKFENYLRLLRKDITKGSGSLAEDSPEARLLILLTPISELQSPSELSLFASGCVKSTTLREVHRKHRDRARNDAGSSTWYKICHHVGRLGSWVRAIRVVVCFAREQPQVFEKPQVGFIDASRHIKPPDADHKTHLYGVLERMLPKDEERAARAFERLKSFRVFDFDRAFTETYKSKRFSPRSHAELLLLDRFWAQELPFYNEDRYVGSSKRSCYCCSIFFDIHNGDIATRPTHGNVWPKWCLPPGLMREDETRFDSDGRSILKRMTEKIGQDILQLIEAGVPCRGRFKDSTTAHNMIGHEDPLFQPCSNILDRFSSEMIVAGVTHYASCFMCAGFTHPR